MTTLEIRMSSIMIIWDGPDDPDGNIHHIAAHNITVDESTLR